MNRVWIERLRLDQFRNYERLTLDLDSRPVVLTGPNGAGKTNLLEAVSLLIPGRGLGRARFSDMIRQGATAGWTVNARLHGHEGLATLGTGYDRDSETTARQVSVDGVRSRSPGVLSTHCRCIWLIPAMDGLFTGSAGERRRFLDKLIQSLDPSYRASLGRFERAMRQRNKLLEQGEVSDALYEGLEIQMAEEGVALAATRVDTIARLEALFEKQRADGEGPFPWATLQLEGFIESRLEGEAAVDVEDAYRARLRQDRERDRAARRTLTGPHRSDLLTGHGPKNMPAEVCSTGEQKALLIGLVLSHAWLVKQQSNGLAPLVLLDEIVAHLDEDRRAGLFDEILRLEAQAWMTGTDASHFAPLGTSATHLRVENGGVEPQIKLL